MYKNLATRGLNEKVFLATALIACSPAVSDALAGADWYDYNAKNGLYTCGRKLLHPKRLSIESRVNKQVQEFVDMFSSLVKGEPYELREIDIDVTEYLPSDLRDVFKEAVIGMDLSQDDYAPFNDLRGMLYMRIAVFTHALRIWLTRLSSEELESARKKVSEFVTRRQGARQEQSSETKAFTAIQKLLKDPRAEQHPELLDVLKDCVDEMASDKHMAPRSAIQTLCASAGHIVHAVYDHHAHA